MLIILEKQVLDVMFEEEIDKNKWKMPDEEPEEHDEYWGFEDLEFEFYDSSTSSPSLEDSVSTKSSQLGTRNRYMLINQKVYVYIYVLYLTRTMQFCS